jgi:hypothetical protein
MYGIRHTVEDRQRNPILAEDLPDVFTEAEELMAFLEDLTATFDHNGFDAKHDRWWAWNDLTAAQLHFWWKVPLPA